MKFISVHVVIQHHHLFLPFVCRPLLPSSQSTSSGLAVLNRLVAQHNIPGVFGPLIDLISCDTRYDKSVETVAGNKYESDFSSRWAVFFLNIICFCFSFNWGHRLFQIVVDTDETVDRLLALMKQERQGRTCS